MKFIVVCGIVAVVILSELVIVLFMPFYTEAVSTANSTANYTLPDGSTQVGAKEMVEMSPVGWILMPIVIGGVSIFVVWRR